MANPEHEDIATLVHVCQQLRSEFLSYWVARLRVGPKLMELNDSIDVFCRTSAKIVLCPRAISIYLRDPPARPTPEAFFAIDMLPLIRLRMRCPKLVYHFEPEPVGKLKHHLNQLLRTDCWDLERIIGHSNPIFDYSVDDKSVAHIFAHSQHPSHQLHVEFVFTKLPHGRIIYLPRSTYRLVDWARLGLVILW